MPASTGSAPTCRRCSRCAMGSRRGSACRSPPLATGALAYVVGIPTLRLKSYYLGMATLGIGAVLHLAFVQLHRVTGGSSGLSGILPWDLGPLRFTTATQHYVLVWAFAAVGLWVARNLVNARVGRVLRALGESEAAAEAMGVDTAAEKRRVFVLSAVYASVAGSLYAHYITVISPEIYSFLFSVVLVLMVAIGGIGLYWGAVVGAVLLTVLPEALRRFGDWEVPLYGLALIVVILFLPRGIAGLFARERRALAPARSSTPPSSPSPSVRASAALERRASRRRPRAHRAPARDPRRHQAVRRRARGARLLVRRRRRRDQGGDRPERRGQDHAVQRDHRLLRADGGRGPAARRAGHGAARPSPGAARPVAHVPEPPALPRPHRDRERDDRLRARRARRLPRRRTRPARAAPAHARRAGARRARPRHRGPRARGAGTRGQPRLRPAKARRGGARARRRADPAPARRARRRAQYQREGRDDAAHRARARRRHLAAHHRARHAPGDGGLRSRGGAGPRREDRGRAARPRCSGTPR